MRGRPREAPANSGDRLYHQRRRLSLALPLPQSSMVFARDRCRRSGSAEDSPVMPRAANASKGDGLDCKKRALIKSCLKEAVKNSRQKDVSERAVQMSGQKKL